jgi:hypothetical protein
MEKQENTIEIVSKKEQIEKLNAERQKMVEFLDRKIKEKEADLQTKKYVIEGKAEVGETIATFLKEKAQWKFSESLGIIESVRQVEEAVKAVKTKKTSELMLQSLSLEAVYYFLTKVEGTGLDEAAAYIKILKPISDALGRSKQDRQDIDQLVRDKGTLESAIDSGVDIENEDEILKEIQAEMRAELEYETRETAK